MNSRSKWEADFLAALRNRTGRYFYGRDVICDNAGQIDCVRYGRLSLQSKPSRPLAKALSIVTEREIALRARYQDLPGRIRRQRPVLHLDPLTVPLYETSARDAVVCHDLGPITHPDLYGPGVETMYREAYERIARSNPTVVFVSRASRNAYASIFGGSDRMHVIYPPVRTEILNATAAPLEQLRPPFLLTVGAIGWRKNQKTSIEGFIRSGLADKGWSYVLCGPDEPGSKDVIELAKRTPGVVLRRYVSDSALVWLYQNAAGFVLASHLEGFGIPVAEAIAAGLIPIVSRDSVLEEVAGEAALSVEPRDPGAIAATMTALARMGDAEKTRRKQSLSASIARFDRATFKENWRAVLANTASGLS